MARSHPLLNRLGTGFHRSVGRSRFFAKLYLMFAGALLRTFHGFPLRQSVINNLTSASWPSIEFSAQDVALTARSKIQLIPHVAEFDFAALFSNNLHYEEQVFSYLESRIADYDAIIEIGANVGIYSVFFGTVCQRLANPANVFVFEPSREAYRRLLDNLRANGLSNVVPFNLAISGQTGFLQFYEPHGHLTNGSLDQDFAGIFSSQLDSTLVPTLGGETLERLVDDRFAILLKIDVEGAEAVVLQSLKGLIETKRPQIVLEVLRPFERALNELGFLVDNYCFFLITDQGLVEKCRFEADNHYRDYLLLPREA